MNYHAVRQYLADVNHSDQPPQLLAAYETEDWIGAPMWIVATIDDTSVARLLNVQSNIPALTLSQVLDIMNEIEAHYPQWRLDGITRIRMTGYRVDVIGPDSNLHEIFDPVDFKSLILDTEIK